MKKTLFTLIATFSLASCDYYEGRSGADLTAHDSIQNGHILMIADEINHLHFQIDSIHEANVAMAKIIIRHDSILAAKSDKAQRRENTGRFIGGILKGLIPGL